MKTNDLKTFLLIKIKKETYLRIANFYYSNLRMSLII